MEQATDEAWSRGKINPGDCFRSIFFWKSWVEFWFGTALILHDHKKHHVLFRFHTKTDTNVTFAKNIPKIQKGGPGIQWSWLDCWRR